MKTITIAKPTVRTRWQGIPAGVKIIPLCPFAKAQIGKHPEWQDVLA
jgi:predicted GNAT family acetyltransferase